MGSCMSIEVGADQPIDTVKAKMAGAMTMSDCSDPGLEVNCFGVFWSASGVILTFKMGNFPVKVRKLVIDMTDSQEESNASCVQ